MFGIGRARSLLSGRFREHLPRVSVVMPTYHREDLLKRAIDSVLVQDFRDFELLVIDDGPSEKTAALLAGIGDGRVHYLPQPRNMGVAAARNRGMREARGEYIAFLDDDDEWLPGKLSAQVRCFDAAPPQTGIIHSWVEVFEDDHEVRVRKPKHRGQVLASSCDVISCTASA